MREYLEYHPEEWTKIFKSEVNNIHFLLPKFTLNIEHIGATSVNNCRSFRNVDILVSTHDLADLYTVVMLLTNKEYKELKELSNKDCVVLVKKYKYKKIGVTVRVVEYGSETYNRIIAFKTLLQESYEKVIKYNNFRERLFVESGGDIQRYNEVKYGYINSMIDDNYRFE